MSDTKLMVYERKHYTSKAWGDESWTAAREPSVGEVVVWLREQGAGEEGMASPVLPGGPPAWVYVGKPGRYLVIPLDTEPPKEGE